LGKGENTSDNVLSPVFATYFFPSILGDKHPPDATGDVETACIYPSILGDKHPHFSREN